MIVVFAGVDIPFLNRVYTRVSRDDEHMKVDKPQLRIG